MTVDIKTNENLKEKMRALLLILNDEQTEPDQPTELNIPCVDINDSDVSNDDNEASSSNVMEVEKKSENVDDVVQQLCRIIEDEEAGENKKNVDEVAQDFPENEDSENVDELAQDLSENIESENDDDVAQQPEQDSLDEEGEEVDIMEKSLQKAFLDNCKVKVANCAKVCEELIKEKRKDLANDTVHPIDTEDPSDDPEENVSNSHEGDEDHSIVMNDETKDDEPSNEQADQEEIANDEEMEKDLEQADKEGIANDAEIGEYLEQADQEEIEEDDEIEKDLEQAVQEVIAVYEEIEEELEKADEEELDIFDHEQEDDELCETIEENGDYTVQDLQENMENVDVIAQDVPEKTHTEAQLDAGKQKAKMHKMTVDIKTNENLKQKMRALLLILNNEQTEPNQPTELNISCVDINDSDVSNDDNEASSSNVMEVDKESENVDDVAKQLQEDNLDNEGEEDKSKENEQEVEEVCEIIEDGENMENVDE